MNSLLNEMNPVDITDIQRILADHENHPQSLCRHQDEDLKKSQYTITKTAMIMDLYDRKMWVTDGEPCKIDFEKFVLD
jgi:isopenicillin-N N-acyltransferase-like protein